MNLIRKPFKGVVAYEWQIGKLVLQWLFDKQPGDWYFGHRCAHDGAWTSQFGRLMVWTDPYWRRQ